MSGIADGQVAQGAVKRGSSGAGTRRALFTIAFLAAAIGLFALFNLDSDRRLRRQMETDARWLEHALRLQLDVLKSIAAETARLVPSMPGGLKSIEEALRYQSTLHPELVGFARFDQSGSRLFGVPAADRAMVATEPMNPAATPSKGPHLGSPREKDGVLYADFFVPAEADGGTVSLTVALSTLLARHIPTWMAERYSVLIGGRKGDLLGVSGETTGDMPARQIEVELAPPYEGLRIALQPRTARTMAFEYLAPAGLAGATLLSIASLLYLRHQSRERRRADARLESEVAFRHSMEASLTVGLRAKDHDGKVLFVNPAFCAMVGYSAAELVGHIPPMPYWLEDIHAEVLRRQDPSRNARPQPHSFETRFRRRDGEIINVQVYEAPLIDAAGQHRGWMGSLIDITEQKRAAEKARMQVQSLQQTGRLVTMGEMASMIAHELNQPLSAIASYATGSLNILRSGKAAPETLAPGLEKLAAQVERAGKIIRRIQDFTRKREPLLAPVHLASIVNDTCSLLNSDAKANGLRLVANAEADLPLILADPILIEQVLVNLVRNGMEAMVANPSRRSDELIITLSARGNSQTIEVIDNGTGIDPSIADRLFETFTSTKPHGMGIGLNICRSIIELHRGSLRHRPNPQGGTVFTIELPVASGEGGGDGID